MKEIRFIFACLVVAIAQGLLVSCSGLSPANKSLYALDVTKPPTQRNASAAQQASSGLSGPSGVGRDQVLQVRRVNFAPPYDGLSLIYRKPDGTYVKDYYNEWTAPPEELFSTQLVDFLSASGAFASVVDGRSAVPHRFMLELCITSLYGDFQDAHNPKVNLDARIYLLDDSSGNRRVVYQKHRDIGIPLPDTSARQFVVGASRAYQQLLESITEDLPGSVPVLAPKAQ